MVRQLGGLCGRQRALASRLRWQAELTGDKMLDAAEELSADKVSDFGCGSGDYLHVAAARRLNLLNGIDEFWTCDIIQAGLAKAVGLKTRLFESTLSAGE